MSFITQIQLGSKGYLDIEDNVGVPLTFSVAEIQDISKRQGSFSKTIKLPGTQNNNILLGQLFDVNITDSSFNQNLREKCIILQRGVPVFNGFLQLLNVTKLSPSQGNPDEQVAYEVAVRDDSGDFYSSISERLLEDLSDFDQYDHIYTLSAITSTSGNTWEDVYKYHLNFNQKTAYNLEDFTPSIFAKAYLDRIFIDAGYTYSWPSLEDNLFDKMVIPYNGDKPYTNLSGFTFRAGFDTGATQTHVATSNNYTSDLIFTDDFTLPNFDNGSWYNTTLGYWRSGFYGSSTFKTAYHYEIQLYAPVGCYLQQQVNPNTGPFGTGYTTVNSRLRITLNHIMEKNNIIPIPLSNPTYYDVALFEASGGTYSPTPITGATFPVAAGLTNIYAGITPEFIGTIDVLPNDDVINKINSIFSFAGLWRKTSDNSLLLDADLPRIVVRTSINQELVDSNYFLNTPNALLGQNQTVFLREFIPKKVKQKDFLADLIKLMNLYITPSTDKDKHLIIETRDEFYNNGGTKDWTDKFVVDQEARIQFLPDLQNKKLRFTYKEDKDAFNTNYKLATGENYGQLEYTFENEFVKDIKTIGPTFSPTPLDTNWFGIIVPTIDSGFPKNNIRILFDGDWIPNSSISQDITWRYLEKIVIGGNTNYTATTFTEYPYAGHLYPNPIEPTDDLNYGLVDYLYYDNWKNVTDNNLYNKYWKRYVNQIENGKLLTARFKLDEYDILNLNFRDKIWVHDTYWFINKISDYNGNGEGLTTVELINVDEGIKFSPVFPDKVTNPIKDNGPKYNWIKNLSTFENRFERNLFGGPANLVEVLGDGNIIAANSEKSMVIGNDNAFAGSQNFIIGNDNTVEGTGVIAFGVSGQTLSDSNVITFGLPVVATTISATSITIGNTIITGATSPFVAGSAGNNSAVQFGSLADATNDYTFASGQDTLASGLVANAGGFGTVASGDYSTAEGNSTQALGDVSHAEGSQTTASGNVSHAEGQNTTAIGQSSHSEGGYTIANGVASHAEGGYSVANGNYSHAEGFTTTAGGDSSHSEGNSTTASGDVSHAGGNGSNANHFGEWARSSGPNGFGINCQYGFLDFYTQTNNTATTELFLGGVTSPAERFDIGVGEVYSFEISILGVNAAGDAKAFSGSGVIKNIGGTTLFVGTPSIISAYADAPMSTATAFVAADNTLDALTVNVNGIAATTIQWYANIKYIKLNQ